MDLGVPEEEMKAATSALAEDGDVPGSLSYAAVSEHLPGRLLPLDKVGPGAFLVHTGTPGSVVGHCVALVVVSGPNGRLSCRVKDGPGGWANLAFPLTIPDVELPVVIGTLGDTLFEV